MRKHLAYTIALPLLLIVATPAFPASDPWQFNVGARLRFANWSGENEGLLSSNTDFSTGGGLFGLSFVTQKGRFFGGLNLQGGDFDFEEEAPDRVGETPPDSFNTTVKRSEFDLLFGYYFWKQVSLFLDYKSITNDWVGESYSARYYGLGGGVSGFIPLGSRWVLFGTFGLVPMRVDSGANRIGDGGSTALEGGAIFRLSEHWNLSMSAKFQNQQFDFDDGTRQTFRINGLGVGINYRF